MLFELSKDKTLLTILSKADLDENTSNLVKSGANPTELKKSLIENINSSNIVEYRKYIIKAEEEEESIREREERKTTDAQRKKIIQLLAQKEGISEDEVDEEKIPKTKKEAKRKIKELTAEAKTTEEIGVDSTEEDVIVQESKREKKLEAAEQSKAKEQESKKKDAQKSLSKAAQWLGEVEDLVKKLDYVVADGKVSVRRMAEYQKFGNNITESNEVISLVMLYEGNDKYLSDRFQESLIEYDFGKGKKETNVLMPYRELKGTTQLMPQPKKAIFVNDLDERWARLTKADYNGVKLSDILKEMHRERHGKQPIVDRRDKQRKEELQRLQRFISGDSPRDASKFKKLQKKMKSLASNISKNAALKRKIESHLKDLQELETEDILARRLKQLNLGIKNLKGVDKIKDALEEIKDIQRNPEPYLKELKVKIEKDIEVEKEKLETINIELGKMEEMRPALKRVRKALMDINFLREDTGQEPAGAIKRILGKLTVHIIRLERVATKVSRKGLTLEDKSDDIVERIQRGENVGMRGNMIEYAGITDIDFESVNSLRELRGLYDGLVEQIDSIMNEYDDFVGGAE